MSLQEFMTCRLILLAINPARTMLRSAQPASKQRRCLHEHWKNCHDYLEAHTWESRAEEDIEEKEKAARELLAAEDNSYLAYDEACKVHQLPQVTGSDLSNKPGGSAGWKNKSRVAPVELAEDSCVLKTTNDDKQRSRGVRPEA
ncbi:hypothetical protein EI94DRAFT_1700762 [Lactarius quietus]|nr:hypothetical protein EI94DRAFT_1703445 [Lactarius quietus]KAF8267775.1 hypothetical protein EI94DRAFT_1700762 [Lactarius quietus]